MRLFEELKRRNVFRVATAYLVASWLILQVADILAPLFDLSVGTQKLILLILIAGFIPALIFAWVYELTPEGIQRDEDVDRSQATTHQTGKRLNRLIIAGLVLVIMVMGVERIWFASETTGQESADTQQSSIDGPRTVAVLPFVNMSSDPEQEFFSDGITEEILNALAKVSQLKVAGRTSSFAFKDKKQDLRLIGETLGVDHILEGSVRKSGDRIRITAQLIKADDGFHMWSETYERQLNDVFAIQDEISAAILEQLKAKLIGKEKLLATKLDVPTYEKFLLGRQKVYQRGPALREARVLLEEVVAADPNFAPAYAQLAISVLLLADRSDMYGEIPQAEVLSTAKPLLDRALELDPDLPEALAGMGLFHFQKDQYEISKAFLSRALDINPSLIDAYNWMYSNLIAEGNLKESWELAEELFTRDPLYIPGVMNLFQANYLQGKLDSIDEMLTRLAPVWNPAFLQIFMAQQQIFGGNVASGISQLHEMVSNRGGGYITEILNTAQLKIAHYSGILEFDIGQVSSAMALSRLGRWEEAEIRFKDLSGRGLDFESYILMLEENQKYEQIVELVESRFPDLDLFEARFAGSPGFGLASLGSIAYAYQRKGNTQKFVALRERFGRALDRQSEAGGNNPELSMAQAFHSMLQDDEESALKHYEQAIEQGLLIDPRWIEWREAFKPLTSRPEFEDIHAPLNSKVNEVREALGLAPIS